jgi:hypothetical protein
MAYQLKTTIIKGKEYVQVNERISAFRKLPEYSGFSIETEVIAIDSETCVIKATIRDNVGTLLSTGIAQEDRSSSMINKTSFVENCETSAVGRALGFLGIGIESSIATAEEVSMAIAKQDIPAAPKAPVELSKALSYIQEGTNPPERKKRFDDVVKKYGSELSATAVESLKALVTQPMQA